MDVVLTPQAKKDFLKLQKSHRNKVEKRLLFLEDNPFAGKRLLGEFEGLRSLRVWPHRIIYLVEKKKNKIWIVSILHRQKVYKKK